MVTFFTIRIDGLDERIQGLNNIVNGLETAKQEILSEVSNFMANEMRRNAHVITGRMKSSINNSVQGDTATVDVPVEYAVYENRRIGSKAGYGPHNFADMASQATESRAPQIVSSVLDRLFANY